MALLAGAPVGLLWRLIGAGLVLLALFGAIGMGVHKVKQWGAAEVRAEWDAANEDARQREAKASIEAAKDLADARKKRKIVVQERTVHVEKIVDRPVYRNQCLDAAGLRCLEGAVLGKGAAGCKPD